MSTRWLMLWLSLAGVLLGMTLLLLFIEYFAVPQFLTGGFQPAKCRIIGFRRVPFKKSIVCENGGKDIVKQTDATETDRKTHSYVHPTTFPISIEQFYERQLEHNTSLGNKLIGNNSVHEESNCLHVSAFNYMKCIEQSSGYFTQSNRSETENGSQFPSLAATQSSFSGASNVETAVETDVLGTDNSSQFERQNIITATALQAAIQRNTKDSTVTDTNGYESNSYSNDIGIALSNMSAVDSSLWNDQDAAGRIRQTPEQTSNVPDEKRSKNIEENVLGDANSLKASDVLSTYEQEGELVQHGTTPPTLFAEKAQGFSTDQGNSGNTHNLIKGSKFMSNANHTIELSEVVQSSASNKSDQLHSTTVKNDSEVCNRAQQCSVLEVYFGILKPRRVSNTDLFAMFSKKVLLRERKRHTARHVSNTPAVLSLGGEPSCSDVTIVDGVETGEAGGKLVFQNSWTYYKYYFGSYKCTCPQCHITIGQTRTGENDSISYDHGLLDSQPVQAGDVISCYYNIYQVPTSEILLKRHSTAFVVNVMLWPTVIFTAGFCGLVFACLFVQRDECKLSCSLPRYFLPCGSERLL